MLEFFQDAAAYPFLRYALLAALLASVACGIMGSFVVVRRSTYIAGAISHTVLGGMGIAHYLSRVHDIDWATPLLGAAVAALLAALIMGFVTLYASQREDTILSALWAIGMAVGISFITATPGYYEDLMSYLFGNILMVGRSDLWLMGILDFILVVLVLMFYNKFLAISFQEELARLRGVRAGAYHFLLLVMIALTVVLLVQIVGIILVIALLALPAATAGLMTQRLWQMMLAAMVLSMIYTVGGLAISYSPEWPAGATIVEVAGIGYLLVLGGVFLVRKFRPRPH